MLTAAACAQVNEAINSRDRECNEVPDDICLRLADDLVSLWDRRATARDGPIVLVTVRPVDCSVVRPNAETKHCWEVTSEGAVLGGGQRAGIGTYYFQTNDGRIFEDTGRVVGN